MHTHTQITANQEKNIWLLFKHIEKNSNFISLNMHAHFFNIIFPKSWHLVSSYYVLGVFIVLIFFNKYYDFHFVDEVHWRNYFMCPKPKRIVEIQKKPKP